ncbi:unnamed protein product [Arabidopsis halleri]
MKFTAFVFIVFVVGVMASPVLIRATVVKHSVGEADVTCTATELSTCAVPMTTGIPPSTECCTKLKEQQPCFCTYIKDPKYSQYVGSPNAKKTLATCGVPYPTC